MLARTGIAVCGVEFGDGVGSDDEDVFLSGESGSVDTATHSPAGVWISRPGCPGSWKRSVTLP